MPTLSCSCPFSAPRTLPPGTSVLQPGGLGQPPVIYPGCKQGAHWKPLFKAVTRLVNTTASQYQVSSNAPVLTAPVKIQLDGVFSKLLSECLCNEHLRVGLPPCLRFLFECKLNPPTGKLTGDLNSCQGMRMCFMGSHLTPLLVDFLIFLLLWPELLSNSSLPQL